LVPISDFQIVSSSPAIARVPPDAVKDRLDAYSYDVRFLKPLQALQACACQTTPLRKITKRIRCGPFGSSVLAETYVEYGVPLMRPVNLAFGLVDFDDVVRVSPVAVKEAGCPTFGAGAVLFARVGNMNTGVVPDHIDSVAIGPNIIAAEVASSVDPFFVGAFAASHYGLAQLERWLKVVAQPTITTSTVQDLLVPLPPRPVQEYIGAKVRLAERCRTWAQELWKASQRILSEALGMPLDMGYFERIDPDELQSASYRLVGVKPVVAWVQTDLVEHELGSQYFHPRRANVILKLRSAGVELKRLADLTRRRNDRVSAAQVNQVPYYVGLADIDSTMGYFDPVSPQDAGISGTSALFKADDILFSKLRPYLNKVSICPPQVKQASGSTELLVYRTDKTVLPYYVFFVLKSNVGLYQIVDVTTGSTLPRVGPEVVDDALVPIISVEHQQVIDSNVKHALALRHQASQLVREAKADVEALIEGRLDVDGIVAGRVQPPAWEEVAPA
jgi:hypothetical protein